MNERPADEDGAQRTITRALGDELRRVRDGQGLTRAEVAKRMSTDISIQTLANYEHGIRQCAIPRLVEICDALGVPVTDLIGLALQRAGIGIYSSSIQVDLHAVADGKDAQPSLRTWARHRLAEDPKVGVFRLEQAVIQEFAALSGLSRVKFVKHLLMFTPPATRPWEG
jgi:transcriptional regulator with XRE-family HTH domain